MPTNIARTTIVAFVGLMLPNLLIAQVGQLTLSGDPKLLIAINDHYPDHSAGLFGFGLTDNGEVFARTGERGVNGA